MQLSYLERILCLTFGAAALLQYAMEFTVWALCPVLPGALVQGKDRSATRRGHSLRATERTLFLLALVPRLVPWLLVLDLLVPAYMRAEDTKSAERVSLLVPMLALGFLLWYFFRLLRLGKAIDDGRRCVRDSYPADEVTSAHGAIWQTSRAPQVQGRSSPVLVYPGQGLLLAVSGVFSSSVIVSRNLLDSMLLAPEALEVAFAHERAHIRCRDNLKLLLLTLLPHLPIALQSRPSLEQRWRLAVEMAADEEGTLGQPERSVLLAEMLVFLARKGTHAAPRAMLPLHSSSEHLRIRVERLLEPAEPFASSVTTTSTGGRVGTGLRAAGLATAVIALSWLCFHLGHRAAEFLFHVA